MQQFWISLPIQTICGLRPETTVSHKGCFRWHPQRSIFQCFSAVTYEIAKIAIAKQAFRNNKRRAQVQRWPAEIKAELNDFMHSMAALVAIFFKITKRGFCFAQFPRPKIFARMTRKILYVECGPTLWTFRWKTEPSIPWIDWLRQSPVSRSPCIMLARQPASLLAPIVEGSKSGVLGLVR